MQDTVSFSSVSMAEMIHPSDWLLLCRGFNINEVPISVGSSQFVTTMPGELLGDSWDELRDIHLGLSDELSGRRKWFLATPF